jgi:membrane-bound ClpP family serine protease
MDQIPQILGAILILIAFAANQRGTMSPQSTRYLALNLIGSLVLAVVALLDEDLGFLLLEGVWAAVSAYGLVQALRGAPPGAPA